jgi:hypothetical protein
MAVRRDTRPGLGASSRAPPGGYAFDDQQVRVAEPLCCGAAVLTRTGR